MSTKSKKSEVLAVSASIATVETAPIAQKVKGLRAYLPTGHFTESNKPSKSQTLRKVAYGRFIVGGSTNGLWLEKDKLLAYGRDEQGTWVVLRESDADRLSALHTRLGISIATQDVEI